MRRRIFWLSVVAWFPVATLGATAVVNTPGDGFLSMRSEPSTTTGFRLDKIPHATPLAIDDCIATSVNERWCKTTYQGKSGWVLDKYITQEADRRGPSSTVTIRTPDKGDAERKAILNAVRSEYDRPVVFEVLHLGVAGKWAWVTVRPKSADGREGYENQSVLLEKQGSQWRKIDGLDLGADCGEEPCPDTDQEALQRRHPEVPTALFKK